MNRSKALRMLLASALLAVTLSFITPAANAAKAGDLDPGLGEGGVTRDPQSSRALAVAATPDRKYIAAGCEGRRCEGMILARYLENGQLDPSFDADGVARFNFDAREPPSDEPEVATALAIEGSGSDYKIVAAGEVRGRFALARFNADGSLDTTIVDPTYGPAGQKLVPEGVVLGPVGSATSLALQGNKWILAGKSFPLGVQGDDIVIARFNSDGTPDSSFNSGAGHATVAFENVVDELTQTDTSESADGVVTDPSGKIYAVGYMTRGGPQDRSMAAIRLTPDGVLDTTFGDGGVFIDGGIVGEPGSLSSALLQGAGQPGSQPEPKLVAAGRRGDKLALVRFQSDGTWDETFGDQGTGIALGPEGRAAALIQQGSSLVAAGRTSFTEEQATYHRDDPDERDVLVARFTSEGRPDLDFGSEGSVVTDMGALADEATSVTGDASQEGEPRIVLAGLSGRFRSFNFILARYRASAVTGKANLALTGEGSPDPVEVGAPHVYETTILNRGPDDAVAVRLQHSIPPEVDLIKPSIESSRGVCLVRDGTIECDLGGIPAGASAKITVTVAPTTPGIVTSSASVTTSSTDVDLSNNSASLKTTVFPAEGVFSAAADMNEARADRAAVLLTGAACQAGARPPWCGKVLLVGQRTSELYDPRANRWIPIMDPIKLDHGQGYTATLLSDGRVLVVGTPGGKTSTNALSLAEIYDPSQGISGTWTVIRGPNVPRDGHVAVRLADGRVLVAGGVGNETVSCPNNPPGQQNPPGGNLKSAEIFNFGQPEGFRWTTTRDMPSRRASTNTGNATATLLRNNRVLVVGGLKGQPWIDSGLAGNDPNACDGKPPVGSGDVFDPDSDTWEATGGPPIPRTGHSATALPDGKVLIAGGNTTVGDKVTTPHAALYDPSKVSWTTTDGLMLFGRMDHAAALLPNGKVLITGGRSSPRKDDHFLPITAELYDPSSGGLGRFTSAGITSHREGHTATTLPPGSASGCGSNCGKVLVTGGRAPTDMNDIDGSLIPLRSSDLYTSPPSVTRVEPPEGPLTGNTEIVMSGLALASASEVTFEGLPPLPCGPKGQAQCWVDEELPDRKLHVITPAHAVPEQVDLVVETLPGLVAAAHFRYTGVELPSGPPPPVPGDAGALPGQQTTRPPAPPSGTATSVQSSNPSAAQSPLGAPGAVPPGAVAPSTVVAQSPQSIPQGVQSVQAAAGAQLALQRQFGLSPGLAPALDEEPRPAPRFMFSRLEEPHLVLGWAASVVLGALAFCVIGMGAAGSAGDRPAAGRARAGPEGCRRIAI